MTDIQKAIRVALALKDWRQVDLAERMGISKGSISNYMAEGRTLTIDTVNKIASALEMKTSDLIALGEE